MQSRPWSQRKNHLEALALRPPSHLTRVHFRGGSQEGRGCYWPLGVASCPGDHGLWSSGMLCLGTGLAAWVAGAATVGTCFTHTFLF